MLVGFNASTFHRTRWYEYVIRFAIGGLATLLAGIIADRYGPGVGGLFLAFPAIFGAAATLIQQHERKKQRKHGAQGYARAAQAAALDATGVMIGCAGLLVFAVFVWRMVAALGIALSLGIGVVLWASVNLMLWGVWRLVKGRLRRRCNARDKWHGGRR